MSSSCAQTPVNDQTDGHADILTRYNSYFRTQPAASPALVRLAQAIRFQVYCVERKFEKASEHNDCLERDAFDDDAVHCLIFHRPSGAPIGTTRLILPTSENALAPIRQLLRANGLRGRDYFPLASTGEVSRFAISNQFRRRRCDNGTQGECRGNLPCLGLIQELLRQSIAHDLTHWAAVMEPKLLRMLALMGIHFTPVGPLVAHHGLRQPSYCYLPEMLERLKLERPDHWTIITDGGTLAVGERRAHRRMA